MPLFSEYCGNVDLFKNLFQMMRALLRTQGVLVTWSTVWETWVNPTAAARRWSRTVARRVYHVPYPNSFWDIDGNMRLIRLLLTDLSYFFIFKKKTSVNAVTKLLSFLYLLFIYFIFVWKELHLHYLNAVKILTLHL